MITTFTSGAIRDSQEGKPDFIETTSPWADWRYAQYMTGKKKKYGQGNFKKGITRESYLTSLARHVVKLRALEDCKTFNLLVEDWMEPDEDHAAAIRFNIDGLMHQEEVEKAKEKHCEQQIDKGIGYD
jgi:dATP/dGTP diphosphohydrolase